MFDSLEERMKQDEDRISTRKERIMRYAFYCADRRVAIRRVDFCYPCSARANSSEQLSLVTELSATPAHPLVFAQYGEPLNAGIWSAALPLRRVPVARP